MEYTHMGDINLGTLNEEEEIMLLDILKTICKQGIRALIKKFINNTYLSVPISIPCMNNQISVYDQDLCIYLHPNIPFGNKQFYYEDMTVPELNTITFITYDIQIDKIITNNTTNLTYDHEDNCLYEIFPVDTFSKDLQEKLSITKSYLLYSDVIFI
jgi:hypothetical protein